MQSSTPPIKFHKLCLIFTFAFVFSLVWISTVYASEPGDLDTTFNTTGIVTTSITGGSLSSIAIQSDGKIVAVGSSGTFPDSDITLIRYESNGVPDGTFGNSGIVTTSISSRDFAGDVAIQPDGKIVIVGAKDFGSNSELTVIRYNANGDLDAAFGSGGIVTTPITNITASGRGVATLPDGKIIVGGNGNINSNIVVIRYNNDGGLDTTFKNTGIVTTSVSSSSKGISVATQPDGKVIVAGSGGSDFIVARYDSNGSLDTTFNGTGVVITPINPGLPTGGAALAIQTDGKIVVAGQKWINAFNQTNLVVARYTVTGSLDTDFNNTGIVHTALIGYENDIGVALQANGKIVVGSNFVPTIPSRSDIAIVRYNQDGTLDNTFKGTGIITTPIGTGYFGKSVAIQPDGKIVVGGSNNSGFAIVRYIGDPILYNFVHLPIILKETP